MPGTDEHENTTIDFSDYTDKLDYFAWTGRF